MCFYFILEIFQSVSNVRQWEETDVFGGSLPTSVQCIGVQGGGVCVCVCTHTVISKASKRNVVPVILEHWFSNFSLLQNYLKDLFKKNIVLSLPNSHEFQIQQDGYGALKCTFLINSQVILMLLLGKCVSLTLFANFVVTPIIHTLFFTGNYYI